MSCTITLPDTVLGKRKAIQDLVLHLPSSPEPTSSDFDNKSHQPLTKKLHTCSFQGCEKTYSKPSRLAEHQRSHTGEACSCLRPFVCDTCQKSYLRETHLQAHVRSHLPQSARPLVCSELDCTKRFWTSQHLRVHLEWHKGVKPFTCREPGCNEAFAKQHQLRSHACTVHAPPGTKPYRCDHDGCTKSFSMNHHLQAHRKTHDEKRYTCVHNACLAESDDLPIYFPTWTALQYHMRTEHPPTCTHPSCNGRVFSCQKNLHAHQKLHVLRDLEEQLDSVEFGNEQPVKKRRGGDLGRDWKCTVDGCEKDFKSKKALATHTNVTHLGRRDFVCPRDGCDARYGYKHLLQRHIAKDHTPGSNSSSDEEESGEDKEPHRKQRTERLMNIDEITGVAYSRRAEGNKPKILRCPYPNLKQIYSEVPIRSTSMENGDFRHGEQSCDYVFTRAYDVRRHLRAVHSVNLEKEEVEEWVRKVRTSTVYSGDQA
ncbi:hypothetical protein AMATHDRAFT_199122 [Amanita thiersii Skay4041]|uniref:C2H2-type domain-containing protein n=1 Tax=Amanita thiersii Skay4041 TaxID=703135 RepID=A0A2A9NG31_9AGAR|nr:hypothetical protein AMATHDRAFT_199122 [Amanita thiersii Skay4041]